MEKEKELRNELLIDNSYKIGSSDWHKWRKKSVNEKLDEKTIRKEWPYLRPELRYNIVFFQKLSESFIRDHQDTINWWAVACTQKFSEEFYKEFKYKFIFGRGLTEEAEKKIEQMLWNEKAKYKIFRFQLMDI